MRNPSAQAQPQAKVARSFVPRARFVLLGFFLALAFALRVYHLGTQALWWDESLTYTRAVSDLFTILTNQITIQNLTTHDLHPPLYFLILHFLVPFVGVSEYALRFLGTFANVLSLPLIFLLARKWFDERTALVSVAIAALAPFYVYYSQEARPYTPVLFWSLLALYALTKFQPRHTLQTSTAPAAFIRPTILYFAATLAMLVTMYLSFLLLPFHALVLFLQTRSRRVPPSSYLRYLYLLPLVIFLIIFFSIPVVSQNLAGAESAGPQFVPWFVLLRDVLNSFSVGVTADLNQVWLIDLALLALFGVGLISAWRRRGSRLPFYVLLSYALIPILALQLGSYLRPLYMNSRHLLIASPPFYIGLAVGIVALARSWKTFAFAFVAAALFLFADGLSLNNLYFNLAYAKDDHRAWVEYLGAHVRPGDGLILVAPQAETIVNYYAPDVLPWQSLPLLVTDRAEQARLDNHAVAQAYQKYSRVWLLEMHEPVADPNRSIQELLRRFGTRLDRVFFRGLSTEIVLSDFVPDSPFTDQSPQIAHPLRALFDDNLELLGYDTPDQASAGERATAKFFWRLQNPTDDEYTTSLLVKDDAGVVWGQADALLLGNLWPTSHWDPNQIATEVHDLNVDPAAAPGRYQLELQVYRRANGERVGDPIALGTLQVTRPTNPIDVRKLDLARVPPTRFGALEFVGYNLDVASARPGDTVPLALYFKLDAPAPDAARIRGHVAFANPFLTFWNFASTVFAVSTRDKQVGDFIRVPVNLRVPPDLNGGDYMLTLALDGNFFASADLETVRVESIARADVLPGTAQKIDARFGDNIELAGYQTARDGNHLTLTLYWRTRGAVNTSYTVFTHVLDAQNHVIAQHDSTPQDGARPTTSWATGEIITDVYQLELPSNLAPGDYPIEIGFYDATTNARLPVFVNSQANGDRLLLPSVQVR